MFGLGRMLKDFHRASASFVPPANSQWRPLFGRHLGNGPKIIGHCDLGDWNIIAQCNQPVGFIDWEQAGPVDPMVELAQLCWLNAHLFDDDLQERLALPPLAGRAGKLRSIVDGYGLAADGRANLVCTMIELAVHDTANEAIKAKLTPESSEPVQALWAMAWRSRSAAWMLRNKAALEAALL
jgi:aminoglycoside phosphotransferase (APT) family kinase protein